MQSASGAAGTPHGRRHSRPRTSLILALLSIGAVLTIFGAGAQAEGSRAAVDHAKTSKPTKTLTPRQMLTQFGVAFSREVLYQSNFPVAGDLPAPEYVTIEPHTAVAYGKCPTVAQVNKGGGQFNFLNFETDTRKGITDVYCASTTQTGKTVIDRFKLNGVRGICGNAPKQYQADCSTMDLQPALAAVGAAETQVIGIASGDYGRPDKIMLDKFMTRARIWFGRLPANPHSLKEITVQRSRTAFRVEEVNF